MKLITFLLAIVLTASCVQAADTFAGSAISVDGVSYTAVPVGRDTITAYLLEEAYTKFCFYVPTYATSFGVYATPTVVGSDATDSLNVSYRTLQYLADQLTTPGSALIPLPLRSSTGVASEWIDWTSGRQYFAYDSTTVMDFKPIGGRWVEVWVRQCLEASTEDSSLVTIGFITFPRSPYEVVK